MTVRTSGPVQLGAFPAAPASLASLPLPLPDDVDSALALAPQLTSVAESLGAGGTRSVWELLATLAAHDLGVARTIEPHLDAAAILFQAGCRAPAGTWGVFAAEGSAPLRAVVTSRGWVIDGVKPWCSLAGRLEHALVTAHTEHGERRLFAVDLTHSGIETSRAEWPSRGLAEIPSIPIVFHRVPVQPVGEPGWYLTRPGFWWGGIGVAACWYGGAVGLARTILSEISPRRDPHALAHLGAIDTLVHACRLALGDAAERIDGGVENDGRLLARRVRGLVARSCEEIIVRAGHAAGPGPLTGNAHYSKQMSDLQVYIRQHHAERDDASHGTILADGQDQPW